MAMFTITLEGLGGLLASEIIQTEGDYVKFSDLVADLDWQLAAGDIIRIEVES